MREYRFSKEGLWANARRAGLICFSTIFIVLVFGYFVYAESGEDPAIYLIVSVLTLLLCTGAVIVGILIGNHLAKDNKLIIDGPFFIWTGPMIPTVRLHYMDIKSVSVKRSRILVKSKSSWSKIRIPRYIERYDEVANIFMSALKSQQYGG